MTRQITAACLLAVLLTIAPAGARADEQEPEKSPWARVELRADLQNLFIYRNDADFDSSEPKYNENGQSVGALATMFTPRLTLHILQTLRIHYEVELGLNFWSKQNPDQADATAADVFIFKHREVYGAGEFLDDSVGLKVGYAHFTDPTGLFINHWMGVFQTSVRWNSNFKTGLFVGQLPDTTYEGILLVGDSPTRVVTNPNEPAPEKNNFVRDIWVFGADTEVVLADWMRLTAALGGLYDSHLVDKTRWLAVPSVRLELLQEGEWGATLDMVLQAGQFMGQALGQEDQTVLAWAAQAGGFMKVGAFTVSANLLFLSPDDAHDKNGNQHAFLASAKNGSATLMLTEDEVRDWYDNIDERMSGYQGGLFINRAGLFVGDVKASWQVWDWFTPSLIVGAATVLKPENADDGVLVGVEADVLLAFKFSNYLAAHVVGGVLIPGAAAGRLGINTIDRDATDPMGMLELSLTLSY